MLAETSIPAAPPGTWRRIALLSALVLLIGIAWALAYLWHAKLLTAPALYEEPDIGWHLASGHGFRTPYSDSPDAPYTSWSPPVYPYIVDLAYRLFGIQSPAASAALGIVNAVCFAAAATALFLLGTQLFWPGVGLLASALFYLHPMFLRATGKAWDAYPALAMFLWLIVAAIHLRRGNIATGWRMASMAGLGVLSALLLLTNASYGLTIPAIALLAVLPSRSAMPRPALKTTTIRVASAFFAAVLVLTPWTVRNYLTFHQLIPIRGGANLELWFGNLPDASGWLNSNSFGPHPGHDLAQRKLMLDMGEPAYFRYCGQRFWQNYHADPAAFWQRTGRRIFYVFFSNVADKAHYPFMPDRQWHGIVLSRLATNGLVVLLGLSGMVLAWRLGWRTHFLPAIALLAVVPFFFTAVWDRHTMPLRSILLLFAAFAIAAIWQRLRSGLWPTGQHPHSSSGRASRWPAAALDSPTSEGREATGP